METEIENPKRFLFSRGTETLVERTQIQKKIVGKIKRKIVFNLGLLYLIPKFLILGVVLFFWDYIYGSDYASERYWTLIGLLIFSFIYLFILIRIKIKKPNDREVLGNHSIRIGWLVVKISHHQKNRLEYELKFKDRYLCSGCFGAAAGLLTGIVLGAVYVTNLGLSSNVIGIISIYGGFFTFSLSFSKFVKPVFGIKRLIMNSFSTLGIWIIIIGADIYFGGMVSLIFIFTVIPFLIFERIYITKLDHKKFDLVKNSPK